jgi:hypothetical protein
MPKNGAPLRASRSTALRHAPLGGSSERRGARERPSGFAGGSAPASLAKGRREAHVGDELFPNLPGWHIRLPDEKRRADSLLIGFTLLGEPVLAEQIPVVGGEED